MGRTCKPGEAKHTEKNFNVLLSKTIEPCPKSLLEFPVEHLSLHLQKSSTVCHTQLQHPRQSASSYFACSPDSTNPELIPSPWCYRST